MANIFYIIIFIILIPTITIGQNEAVNWYFGEKVAITFKTHDGNPVALKDSKMNTLEGCSSISDTNGNLLFYTDGVKIWNKKHQLINPKIDLDGHYSSSQSALIIRKPQSYNLYYIFTTYAGEYIENIDPSNYKNLGLNYSIVDMSLNKGLGEVIEYNKKLIIPCTEKLTATFHANYSDVWIISHEWDSKNIVSFLLTQNGIEKTVYSESSAVHSGENDRYIGYMKCSPLGDKIAFTMQGVNYVEVLDFDNSTGRAFNPIRINTDNRKNNYGIEFSNDGKLIYVSEYENNKLYQYDISSKDTSLIKKSEYLVFKDTVSHSIGALQLAPNGKIYLAINASKFLSVINEPDIQGEKCDFIFEGISFADVQGSRSKLGLPNYNQSFFNFNAKIITFPTCEHNILTLNAHTESEFDVIEYKWKGPKGFTSKQKKIEFKNADSSLNGKYHLSVKYRDYKTYDSVEVQIKDAPLVKIIGDTLICINSFAMLEASIINDDLSYLWSTGETSPGIVITSPGKYILHSIYKNGCSFYDTILVKGMITNAGFEDINSGKFNPIPIENTHKLLIKFVNNGTEPLLINSVYFEKNSLECRIKSSDYSGISLPANYLSTFIVEIYSKSPHVINDSLVIEVVSPYCTMNFKLSIEGKIIVPVLVSIPSLFSSPAEILEIPISAQLKVQTDTSFNSPFKIKLSMPAHYFSPDRVNNPAIQKDSIYDGLRYLEIIGNINGLNSSDRNLIKFTGTVLVGDIVPAEIKIIETIWNDTLFVNDYDNGELNIEDCSLDLRQIKLFTPTKMNFSPNPIENENLNVRVFSEEIGEFELFLFNNEGGKFHLTKWTRDEISQTEFSFNFHLNNYPSGFYNLVLKSPWYSVVEKIRLVR